LRRIPLFIALFLVVAACGDDSGGTTTAPPTTAAPTTSTTTEPATTTTVAGRVDTEIARFIAGFGDAGDCIDLEYNAAGDEFDYSAGATAVSCDGPHDHEVFFVGELNYGPQEAYPGDDAVAELVFFDLCEPAFQARYGAPSDFAVALGFWATWPLETEWDLGLRTFKCSATPISNPSDGSQFLGNGSSAGLTLPGHLLATVAEFDSGKDIYIYILGDEGEILDTVNLTFDDLDLNEELTPPSWSPDLSTIVYAAEPPGEGLEVFAVNTSSGEKVNLTNHPASDGGPTVSPDGTKVLFTSDRASNDLDIFVMNIDGTNVTQLTFDADRESSPDWSPDGSQIVFRKRTNGNSDIWVMNADGSDQRFLVGGPAGEYDPDWSPDGSTIAFISDENGDFDIWTFPAEGITTIGAPPSLEAALATRITDFPGNEEYPDWTPDGQFIIYNSDLHGSQGLWMMRADGTDATNLLFTSPVGFGQAARP
jgi:hypothetical protein